MRDRSLAARLLTLYTLDYKCTHPVFAFSPNHDCPAFPDPANLQLCLVALMKRVSTVSVISFSAFTPDNLNTLPIIRAGISSTAVHSSDPHLQTAWFHRFFASRPAHPRYRRGIMADPNRGTHFLRITSSFSLTDPRSVAFEAKNHNHVGQVHEKQQLSFSTSSKGKPHTAAFPMPRCSEKGCAFPASSLDSGKCSYHTHQQEEPTLFRSRQPTGLLLDPARVPPTEREDGSGRKRDRRRMAAIWEQFQRDGTT